jgi:hypothetical protein
MQVAALCDDFIAGPVSVADTTELRWFIDGPLPPDVKSWFTPAHSTPMTEKRCDIYRLDPRSDIGLKLRHRETLELKTRQLVGEQLTLGSGLTGRLEAWRKWSPADSLINGGDLATTVDVHKMVIKRRFSLDGDEINLSKNAWTMPAAGCDVEIAAVTVGVTEAWTYAFAAYGPTSTRRDALLASWQTLTADTPCPERLAGFKGQSSGYPEWLTLLTSPAVEATVATAR